MSLKLIVEKCQALFAPPQPAAGPDLVTSFDQAEPQSDWLQTVIVVTATGLGVLVVAIITVLMGMT
jgi:hypothetical protein